MAFYFYNFFVLKYDNYMKLTQLNNNLNDLEKEVMFEKHTERAFTGKYDNFYKDGIFCCNNCNLPLYSSKAKFDAGCGWPAFEDCYEGAIKYNEDSDGRRTEIVCGNCAIHLGHVFYGEHLTETNTRHCVNSVSIKYYPSKDSIPETISLQEKTLVVACGCFWGVEYHFKKLNGVLETEVGYIGGKVVRPTYEQICEGKTGHFEALKINYDSLKIKFKDLVKFFFEIHDFEQTDGQGNDVGEQYLSVLFYENQEEKEIINEVIEELIDFGYQVATLVKPRTEFYIAESYHQDYYSKNGQSPYCHFYKKIFKDKL
jgi:peptide methionine sulfoxide reductase msrA/msrB